MMDKILTGVKCSRTACNSQNAMARHQHLNQLYCPRCARKINEWAPKINGFPLVLMPVFIEQCEQCGKFHPLQDPKSCQTTVYLTPQDASEKNGNCPVYLCNQQNEGELVVK